MACAAIVANEQCGEEPWALLPILLFVQPGSDSLLGQTPGVFKGVISYSIALQTRVVYPKGWLMKTPGVLS
jgi:hypothetical protein